MMKRQLKSMLRAVFYFFLFTLGAFLSVHSQAQGRGDDKPSPGGGRNPTGPIIGTVIGSFLNHGRHKKSPEQTLLEDGPQFLEPYSMSDFQVLGFVKGGWHLVLDYQPDGSSLILLELSADGVDPAYYRLGGVGSQREVILIPDRFTNKKGQPIPGLITFHALDEATGELQPAPITLRFLSCGFTELADETNAFAQPVQVFPKARVNERTSRSVNATDTNSFFVLAAARPQERVEERGPTTRLITDFYVRPETIHLNSKPKETVSYGFRCRPGVNWVAVDFLGDRKKEGKVKWEVIKEVKVQGQQIDQRDKKGWDGKDDHGKPSLGDHEMQVRGWNNGQNNDHHWFVEWENEITVE